MKLLVPFVLKHRVGLAELAGAILVIVALALLAAWAGWLAGGAMLLLKALEWDLAAGGAKGDKAGSSP